MPRLTTGENVSTLKKKEEKISEVKSLYEAEMKRIENEEYGKSGSIISELLKEITTKKYNDRVRRITGIITK